ncbi:MAG: TrmB family transcriptional regulator [Candidatus Aenigmarchaeota archaeon]|nr:TrmB family transcriptional regulator [Candidatus Aenigmarchaeota archaeon]
MAELRDAENLSKDLGLKEYEMKAFMALVKYGSLSADKISKLGNIPLPRIYDTLEDLQKKGLVLISKGRPKTFRLVNPKVSLVNYIKARKAEFEKKLEAEEQIAKSLSNILQNVGSNEIYREEKWNIWYIERKGHVTKTLEEIEQKAKNELVVFSGDLSWVKESQKIIRKIIKKGIKIRAVVKSYQHGNPTEKNIEIAKNLGMDVRVGYTGNLRCNIADGKEAAIIYKTPLSGADPDSGGAGSDEMFVYELLFLDNSIIVSVLKENFEFWWNKLREA